MKPTNAWKVIGYSEEGARIWTTPLDIHPFDDLDRVSIEDAWARALRRSEVFVSAKIVSVHPPTLAGEWDGLPSTSDPLPVARPGEEDHDVPGVTADLFGGVRVGMA